MRKEAKLILIVLAMVFIGLMFFIYAREKPESVTENDQALNKLSQENLSQEAPDIQNREREQELPLENPEKRVTKKFFGAFVSPENSPVKPEKFRGYHTGTDFEVFPEELEREVSVRAICAGEIESKTWARGYGGVVVQQCVIENQSATVVYGHLKLESIDKNPGDAWSEGEAIGILGKDKSVETDGERKHLHLGIHKGNAVNILGYVSSREELSGWLDPCAVVCFD